MRGIGTYLRGLLRAYAALGVASRVVLLGDRGRPAPPLAGELGLGAGPGIPVVKRRLQPVLDPLLVSVAVRRLRPALYHAVEWAQPLAPGGVPVVLTVHDLIPFLYPRLYPWVRRERLPALRLARRAGAVVVPSAATGRDVERLARVDPARIAVIHHGVDAAPAAAEAVAAARRRLGLGDYGPYLLAVGTFDGRKRVDALAAVLSRVRRDHDVRLVVTGDQGVFAPAVDAAFERHGVGGACLAAGYLPAAELEALYTGAAALVFPSAYEGFGLPVLEALACGTRVVCFDNSAMPEVSGDAAVLVPDGDVPAMAAAVAAVLGEPAEMRMAAVERGRGWAASFTWERSARAHLEVYAAVEGGAPPGAGGA